jgi:SGNH domain (fused to AT3 domains)
MKRAVAGSLLCALIGLVAVPMNISTVPTQKPGSLKQVKAIVSASVKIHRLTSAMQAALPADVHDMASDVYHIPQSCDTPTECVYGDPSATESVVLYGDSHAEMWLPAIDPIVTSDQLKLIFIGQRGCPVADVTAADRFGACEPARMTDISVINEIEPIAVILANRTTYGFTPAEWQAGMATTLSALSTSGARLAIIGDIQVFNASVPLCLAANPTTIQRCSVANPNPRQPGQQAAEESAASAVGALYVNPIPWLCTARRCSPVVGSDIAYWDAFHVTVTYSSYLARVMAAALEPIL